MSESKGYYSIIQYCPDPAKSEGVNVGVALFVPDHGFADVQVSRNNRRARKFFGRTFDGPRLNAAKKAIRNRIRLERDRFRTGEDIQGFIDRRADAIRLIDPRPMRVGDPRLELRALFEELVEPAPAAAAQPSPKFGDVERLFREQSIEPNIQFNQKVEVPIVGRQLEAPYAYRNGQQVYVVTRQFTKLDQAERLAIEGQIIRKKMKSRLLVVGATPGKAEALRSTTQGVFDFSRVQLFWEENVDELARTVKKELRL